MEKVVERNFMVWSNYYITIYENGKPGFGHLNQIEIISAICSHSLFRKKNMKVL